MVSHTSILMVVAVFLYQSLFIAAHVLPKQNNVQGQRLDDNWMHPGISRSSSKLPKAVFDEDKEYWIESAQAKLKSKVQQRNIEAEAKNTILFLGDGMSIPTVTASRIFKGQSEDEPNNGGEEADLHFDLFPHTALSKTYCTDSQVADSACSATAYLCGVKANIATIGVTNKVLLRDCDAQNDPANQVSSMLAWAQAAGKSTGIVTTARITHASPAGAFAHIAHRDWETDYSIANDGVDADTCDDIAEQLILKEPGNRTNVILGGGRRNFYDASFPDIETGNGYRSDGKDLVKTWQENNKDGKYITNVEELKSIDASTTDHLLGLFAADHLGYLDQMEAANDPTLADMVQVAIDILSKNPNGFFLFVEGGRIDHALHDTEAQRAFVETMEFSRAIKLTDDITNDEDTLLVVTSDHAHTMTINGYPVRGNPILGIAEPGDDGIPYATISFANGPGYREPTFHEASGKCIRYDITGDTFNDITYRQVTMVPIGSETHGGDDVGIFAKGPWAHLFSGVLQQNYIPHAMAYAACIGDGASFCQEQDHKL